MSIRYLLRQLFVVFVCLSVLFSSLSCAFASSEIYDAENFGVDYPINTLAEDEDTTKGNFNIRHNFGYGTLTNGEWEHKIFLLSDSVYDNQMQGYQNSVTFNRVRDDFGSAFNYQWSDQFVIERVDKTKIATKGQALTFSVKDFNTSLLAINSNYEVVRNSTFSLNGLSGLHMYVYGQGTEGVRVLNLTGSDINKYVTLNNDMLTIGGEISELPIDVYKVNVFLTYAPSTTFNNNNGDTSLTSTHWAWPILQKQYGFGDNSSVVLKVDDNTSGLLSSIIAFISSILDGVTNIFSKLGDFMSSVANSFTTLFSKLGGWFTDLISNISSFMSSVGNWFSTLFGHILDLPGIMWGFIEDGLKALFVPDELYIEEYKENWEVLLSDRFGAIYQACDILIDYVKMFDNAVSNNIITLPSISIDLPDNETFTFGGYDVVIVPKGFDFLADSVKLAVDIVCSFLVINSLKRRFECLLGDRL